MIAAKLLEDFDSGVDEDGRAFFTGIFHVFSTHDHLYESVKLRFILFPCQISTNSGFVKYLKIGSQQCCQFFFTFGGSVVKDIRNRGAE